MDQDVVAMAVPKAKIENYNELGQWVLREKGPLSVAQIAERGGISDVTLGRWLRKKPLTNLPPAHVIQALADGMGRPLAAVRQVAARSAGQAAPSMLNDEQQTVVAAMSQMDQYWQRAVVDIVLRLTEEVSRRGEE